MTCEKAELDKTKRLRIHNARKTKFMIVFFLIRYKLESFDRLKRPDEESRTDFSATNLSDLKSDLPKPLIFYTLRASDWLPF